MLDLHLSLFPNCVLPVGISAVELAHEVLLLLLEVLAHLKQPLSARLVLLDASLNILREILVACSALYLLDLYLCDLVFQFLCSHCVKGLLELLSLFHLLLKQLSLQVERRVLVLQLLDLRVEVHFG